MMEQSSPEEGWSPPSATPEGSAVAVIASIISSMHRALDALHTIVKRIIIERDEAQRMVKNLAPTGRYNGLNIEQWKERAERAELQLTAAHQQHQEHTIQVLRLSSERDALQGIIADIQGAIDTLDPPFSKELLERIFRVPQPVETWRDRALAAEEKNAQLQDDSDRFAWWFGPDDKTAFIMTYLAGVDKKYTLDAWRVAIDAARKEKPDD